MRCPASGARPSCSFGVWVLSPGTENAFSVCLYGRLLLALSLRAGTTGNQGAAGRFSRSMFRYLLPVCTQMETKDPCSGRETCYP